MKGKAKSWIQVSICIKLWNFKVFCFHSLRSYFSLFLQTAPYCLIHVPSIHRDCIDLPICTFLLLINIMYLLRRGTWKLRYELWLFVENLSVWQPGKTFISFAVTTTSVLKLFITDVLWSLNSLPLPSPPPFRFKIKCEWKINL